MSNRYEDKQAARRERFEDLADKNAQRSTDFHAASRRAVEHIPMGQPILVGHHSEGRHRADIKRAHSAMDKSCEAQEKADYYARKAAGVGRGGISSDDPEAVQKLRAQLVSMQAVQDRMKAANKVMRTHKTHDERLAALVALGFAEVAAGELLQKDFAGRVGFPAYALSNNSANMRRVELRIKELEANQGRASTEAFGHGYIYREDADENRVMFVFDGKPDEETHKLLKKHGFVWSPSRQGRPWVRHLNNAGLYHAQLVRETLDAGQVEG